MCVNPMRNSLKLFLFVFVLFAPIVAHGQARTAERLVDLPFSRLSGSAPNGSVAHCINCKRQNGPCQVGGAGDTIGTDAVKLGGTWYCDSRSASTGSGDVSGPSASVNNELPLYSDTTGKNLKRSNALTGILLLSSGTASVLDSTGTGNVVRASSPTLATPTLTNPVISSFMNALHTHETSVNGGQLNASSVFSAGTIPPARIISGTISNSKCLRVNNLGQIAVAADDCGIGSGGSPGGVSGNLTFNESGAFGGISTSQYNSITGVLRFTQKANSNDTLTLVRFTDSTPTGTLLRARNAADNTDLFFVSADGSAYFSSSLTSKNIAAPSTPSAGNTVLWTDITDKNLKAQDSSGQVTITLRATACSGTDKVSGISSAGVVTCTADQGASGTGVISLNGLISDTQTFGTTNDTNVTLAVNSVTTNHQFTVGWTGTLAKARQNAATVYNDAANTYSTGAQDFGSATSLKVPSSAGAGPTANGLVAYDTTSNTLEYGENGSNRIVVNTAASQTISNKTFDNSTVANLKDTLLTLQDNADPTKTANFELSGVTSGQNRTITIPDANSVTVQSSTLTASQFVTHIDSSGVAQKAQPSFSNLTGTMGETQGGTGQTSFAQGDILYASATNTLSKLAKSTSATRYLANTGASNNPQWDLINLANGTTGTLPDGSLSANVSLLGSSVDLSGAEATGVLAAGRFPALTGDVTTSSGSLSTTIANDAVSNAKLANMATATFKGRTTSGTGDPEDLTGTQATALLNTFTTSLKGLVPAPGSTTNAFLRDDGTWVIPSGAGDMVLASVQAVTGAKTFDPAKLVVGGQSATPTAVAGAFYRDTDDTKLYWAIDSSTWGEVFVSGLSAVNLASANVTGTLPLANGGTNQTSWTAARCVRVNAGGTALEAAAADCGSGGGTPGGSDTQVQFNDSSAFGGDAGLTYNKTTDTLTLAGPLVLSASGAGYIELAEGAAPTVVANRLTFAAPADAPAGGLLYILPSDTPTNGEQLSASISGTTVTLSWEDPGSGGGGSGTINSGATNTIPKYTASTTIDDSLLSDDATTLAYTGTGGVSAPLFTATGTGAGYIELAEGTAPTVVANRLTFTAPADAPAGGLLYILPADTPSNGEQLTANISGTTVTLSWDTAGSGGGGDSVSVNGSAVTDANFIDTAASGTVPSVTWSLDPGATPDAVSISAIGAASTTEAGVITTGTQSLAGTKLLGHTTTLGRLAQSFEVTTSANSGGVALNTFSTTAGEASILDFNRSKSATKGTQTAVALDDTLGYVTFRGSDGTDFQNAASIQAAVDGAVSAGDMPGRLSFWTTSDGSATPTERWRITNAGHLLAIADNSYDIGGTGPNKPRTVYAGTSVVTPNVNGLTITTSTGTLTIANGKTATVNNSLTFAGTDSTVMTFPGTSGTVVTADSTVTKTNLTLDVEGTGNLITTLSVIDFPAAGCSNTTATSFWDLPTSTPAVAACVSGTNTQKAYLDFADTSGGFSAQTGFRLPADFTGTADAKLTWLTTATSGNVKWSLSTICVATDATETDDPAFNTASTVTTAAAGVASRLQTSSLTSITITGCAAGEFMHVKVFRDGNDAADTISATARLVGVQLVLRRAQ